MSKSPWNPLEPASHYLALTPAEALKEAEALFRDWNAAILRDSQFIRHKSPNADIENDADWRLLSVRLGSRFVWAMEKAEEVILRSGYRGWTPFLQSNFLNSKFAPGNVDSAIERRLKSEYLSGLWHCYLLENMGSSNRIVDESWDRFIYWGMQHLSEAAAMGGRLEHLQLSSQMTAFLSRRARAASEARDKLNRKMDELFTGSVVRTRELRQLANRSDSMVQRYGEKQVESRFEQQLSLLFQSFGFYVVSTAKGERRVDLICLAPAHGGPSYSIFVEAKSTKGSYSLPTKDSRALEEYIQRTSTLTTIPPLRMVLIVGPAPASTIDAKLKSLEVATSVPIRYCEAAFLGSLRDSISGPLSFQDFLRELNLSMHVVDREVINKLRDADKSHRKIHTDFVTALLKAGE
ncbi:hypothetical protein [Actinoplanes siamensis]|uniref:hypothetical protein n=1 Tax=Actinoplanes siamensis TaxID=1223317 RepID=UPI001940A749|nr:hypothetical protein [Actinoplanes siamensis]